MSDPKSFREVMSGQGGEVERERRRQSRVRTAETTATRYLLKHYGLQAHTTRLCLEHQARTGDSFLTLSGFVRTFGFPVWLTARRLLGLATLTASLLLQERWTASDGGKCKTGGPFRRHPLALAYLDASEAAEGTGLPPGLIFSWPKLGFVVMHGAMGLRRGQGTVLERHWAGLEFCLETAPSFLQALGWSPSHD